MKHSRNRTFKRDASGATIIEFAIVAPVFLMLLLATVEFGLYLFTYVTIESAVTQAGRSASINSGLQGNMVAFMEADIQRRVRHIPTSEKVVVNAVKVADGQTLPPDICDTNGTITTDCSCGNAYVEVNNIAGCQSAGQIPNYASTNDLIEVRASLPWKVYTPLIGQLFQARDGNGNVRNGYALISATAVVKNEPEGGGGTPPPENTDGGCCAKMPFDDFCVDFPGDPYCGGGPCTDPNGCGPKG